MTTLKRKPSYSYRGYVPPPTMALDPQSDEVRRVYDKLKSYLARESRPLALGWITNKLALYQGSGLAFHYDIEWMPELKPSWQRLRFDEFLVLYGML